MALNIIGVLIVWLIKVVNPLSLRACSNFFDFDHMKINTVILTACILWIILNLPRVVKEQRESEVDLIPLLHEDQLTFPDFEVIQVIEIKSWH